MQPRAIHYLIDAQDSIVDVSPVSGLGGDWKMSFYNAATDAVTNFTRALAMDHGRDGVRINAVCPSTETDLTQDMRRRATDGYVSRAHSAPTRGDDR